MRYVIFALATGLFMALLICLPAQGAGKQTTPGWPKTDLSRSSVDLSTIMSGGPPKDGIPSIDNPKFIPVGTSDLPGNEPVIALEVNGVARAYPLRILTWHEIVNDEIGGVPVIVTYCPLCNSAIVFDRRFKGMKGATTFGTSGMLRNSNMIMYDRGSETWWQQFTGTGIVGKFNKTQLKKIPARLESFDSFKARFPKAEILVPNNPKMRSYGKNPYASYDSAKKPFLYRGDLPKNVPPMMRVIVVDDTAYSFPLIAEKKTFEEGDLRISFSGEHASALDKSRIKNGQAIPSVVVQKRGADGTWHDTPYDVTFAFVFHAFKPKAKFRME